MKLCSSTEESCLFHSVSHHESITSLQFLGDPKYVGCTCTKQQYYISTNLEEWLTCLAELIIMRQGFMKQNLKYSSWWCNSCTIVFLFKFRTLDTYENRCECHIHLNTEPMFEKATCPQWVVCWHEKYHPWFLLVPSKYKRILVMVGLLRKMYFEY